MAFWAKMLREAFSRSAASSTLRVTFSLAWAASSKSLKIKGELAVVAGRHSARLDLAVGVEQQRLGDGVDDALRVFGEGHVDAGGPLDLPHLAQQHVEHDAVDGVVGAVEQTRLDLGRHLPKAVDAPLALLQPVGVPGQVVVQHGGEVLLQVDAFAQTVGGDQHAQGRLAHLFDALFAQVVGQFAGDDLQIELGEFRLQRRRQLLAHVVGRGDVAAEDDRVETAA